MDVEDYIKYYPNILTEKQCKFIIAESKMLEWKESTYSNDKGKIKSEERVRMDECWVKKGLIYEVLKNRYDQVIKNYSANFPLFSVQRITDFRINRYGEGGFMSKHYDNIHHSHGQQYGYPQVSVLLYLNNDYEGGDFYVADKKFKPDEGSAIIFPSNFMYPHEAKVVTKGTRWSIVAWLM